MGNAKASPITKEEFPSPYNAAHVQSFCKPISPLRGACRGLSSDKTLSCGSIHPAEMEN